MPLTNLHLFLIYILIFGLMPSGWFIWIYWFIFITEISFLIYAHFFRNTARLWNKALVYMDTKCNYT